MLEICLLSTSLACVSLDEERGWRQSRRRVKGGGVRGKNMGKEGGNEGAPKGHRGGSLEEAHTLICHVLVCLGAQKSALQSPVATQATVWFTAAAQMCDYQWETQERVITLLV